MNDRAAPQRTALVLGATGLVGGHLLRQLLADPVYRAVTVIARRSLAVSTPKLAQSVVDFDRLETCRALFAADDVYCCLGTTIKKAGTKEAFRKIDFEYPILAARLAAQEGARQYLIVTAVGADATSGVFYSRVKGEAEEALRSLSFPNGLKIFRPSMLLGDRGEPRPLERAAAVIMRIAAPVFAGRLSRYRAIDAEAVARAMRRAARTGNAGMTIYEGDTLFAMAYPAHDDTMDDASQDASHNTKESSAPLG